MDKVRDGFSLEALAMTGQISAEAYIVKTEKLLKQERHYDIHSPERRKKQSAQLRRRYSRP